MPRLVRAFACEWKCGRNVTTKKADMVRHESRCRNNPAARACPTCLHNDLEPGEPADNDTGYPGCVGGWYCTKDLIPSGKIMVVECESWKSCERKDQP